MEQASLKVETRDQLGKGPARRARMAGMVPGVIYGMGKNQAITLEPKQFVKILTGAGGKNTIFNLQGSGLEGKHAIVRDYQIDPVSRQLLHIDLQEIDVKKKISVTVALNFTGKALGVVDGGVLNIIGRAIEVRCLPTHIPQSIDVDVTPLKIGDSIHIEDVKLPEGIEKVLIQNVALVTVVPPIKEEELAPALAQAAEPEVITEKKKDEEGAAEGAEGKKDAKKDAPKKEDKK